VTRTAIACRDSASDRNEPLWGTADQVDAWLLLEYRGDWSQKAIADNALDSTTDRWLKETLRGLVSQGLRPRLLFVRQPEAEQDRVTVMLNLCGRPQPVLYRRDVGSYAELQHVDFVRMAAEPALPAFQPQSAGLYLVCTNAARDQCCGRYGVPVYLALRERLADRIWQCTHVGGHRFAPNVLYLPSGTLYGRVNLGDLDRFVSAVEAGRVPAEWLRGRTANAYHVQAAEAMLGDGAGPAVLIHEESIGPDRWRVQLRRDGRMYELTVGLGDPIDVLASCRDDAPKPIRPLIRL
jgi:hypothetical protein